MSLPKTNGWFTLKWSTPQKTGDKPIIPLNNNFSLHVHTISACMLYLANSKNGTWSHDHFEDQFICPSMLLKSRFCEPRLGGGKYSSVPSCDTVVVGDFRPLAFGARLLRAHYLRWCHFDEQNSSNICVCSRGPERWRTGNNIYFMFYPDCRLSN